MTDPALPSTLSRFVLEHSPQPLAVLDAAGHVIAVNRAASAAGHLDPSAPFRRHPRDPEVAAFLQRLRSLGQVSWDLPAAWMGSEQTTYQLHGTRVDAHVVVTVAPKEKPLARDTELRQLRRLDALGLLTARVAHDINNLLTPLLLLSRELVCDLEATGHNPSLAREIELTAQRAACVMESVLGFARPRPTRAEWMTLNSAVLGMRQLLELVTGPKVTLVLSLDERPPRVSLDRMQFEQSLLNLVSNAIHAMPDGGELRITATHGGLHPCGAAGADPSHVVLIVSDTGCGMTDDVKQRAFEAFFTTRATSGGTGLGLGSVQRFAREHRGTVTLDSEPGRGTSVAIHLPVSDRAAPSSTPEPPDAARDCN